ncbi:MAG: hypothetical protein JO331_11475 [Verrucomicrobia bacterium]|nr:hypothetical protein [Verrucomicrobiota bacterium]
MQKTYCTGLWLGLIAGAPFVLATGTQASMSLGFDGVSAPQGQLVNNSVSDTASKTFTSNGFTWTASMNGDTADGAAIYYYTHPSGANAQYEVNSPSPSSATPGVIWMDGSANNGTRGGSNNSFNAGPSVDVTLTGLIIGKSYTVNFDYNTEVNPNDTNIGPTGNSKGGPSGLIVAASTSSTLPSSDQWSSPLHSGVSEYTTSHSGPQTNPNVSWDTGSYSFIATGATEYVYFVDDINPSLHNQEWSSNIFLADVSSVPEISPLAMVGVAVVGAIGFSMYLRCKFAVS